MSFERYYEFICEKGHYSTQRLCVYDLSENGCGLCKQPIAYTNLVDQTNGMDQNDPTTLPLPTLVLAEEDHWQTDHYGNKYATVIKLYEPKDKAEWTQVGSE